jgi:hypothetical protein
MLQWSLMTTNIAWYKCKPSSRQRIKFLLCKARSGHSDGKILSACEVNIINNQTSPANFIRRLWQERSTNVPDLDKSRCTQVVPLLPCRFSSLVMFSPNRQNLQAKTKPDTQDNQNAAFDSNWLLDIICVLGGHWCATSVGALQRWRYLGSSSTYNLNAISHVVS